MARFVLTAENFAFGPIGKLLTIADLLKKRGHELIFAGFGTSLQLASDFPFDSIYEIDTDDEKSKTKLTEIIRNSDMLISCMDLQSVIVANNLKKPVAYVDVLFWFWEDIPQPLFSIDLYIREKSINDHKDNENEKKFGSKIKNLFSVGPIIPEMTTRERVDQVIISYGGGEASHWYKVGRDTNYPVVMTKILLNYVDWKPFKRVIVSTGKHILKELAREFKSSSFEFTNCLSHAGFLEEMTRSKLILTTAGLVTSQEAFQSKTPLIYLPPSNNSHYILLDEIREKVPGIPSVHLSDFMEKVELRGMPEEKSIPAVLSQLKTVESSAVLQKKIGDKINLLVSSRKNWAGSSIEDNLKFLNSLGKNGANDVVNKIESVLCIRH